MAFFGVATRSAHTPPLPTLAQVRKTIKHKFNFIPPPFNYTCSISLSSSRPSIFTNEIIATTHPVYSTLVTIMLSYLSRWFLISCHPPYARGAAGRNDTNMRNTVTVFNISKSNQTIIHSLH